MGQRQDVISQFQAPVNRHNRESTPMVMLISLKSGAVGLNLTAASNVFLVRTNHLLLMPTADRSVIRGGNLPLKPKPSIEFIE